MITRIIFQLTFSVPQVQSLLIALRMRSIIHRSYHLPLPLYPPVPSLRSLAGLNSMTQSLQPFSCISF